MVVVSLSLARWQVCLDYGPVPGIVLENLTTTCQGFVCEQFVCRYIYSVLVGRVLLWPHVGYGQVVFCIFSYRVTYFRTLTFMGNFISNSSDFMFLILFRPKEKNYIS